MMVAQITKNTSDRVHFTYEVCIGSPKVTQNCQYRPCKASLFIKYCCELMCNWCNRVYSYAGSGFNHHDIFRKDPDPALFYWGDHLV